MQSVCWGVWHEVLPFALGRTPILSAKLAHMWLLLEELRHGIAPNFACAPEALPPPN